jgi:hypothetical protein
VFVVDLDGIVSKSRKDISGFRHGLDRPLRHDD